MYTRHGRWDMHGNGGSASPYLGTVAAEDAVVEISGRLLLADAGAVHRDTVVEEAGVREDGLVTPAHVT
jgi:hypothetical protein